MSAQKILIYRYGSICEPDIIETLKRLGFAVEEITNEIYNKEITPAECMSITRSKLDSGSFACVFTINFFPWLAQLCNIYNILYFSLIVDSPVMELYSDSVCLPCNRIFLFDACLYNEFAGENPAHIYHLPLATNIARNNRIIQSASDSTLKKYAADISFIGSLYTEKCLYNKVKLPPYEKGFAEGLIDAQLKVYGYNFLEECITNEFAETFLKYAPGHYQFPEKSRYSPKALVAQQYLSVKAAELERINMLTMLSEHFEVDIYTGSDTSMMPSIHNRGFAQSLTQMPLIFNQSKINLNITAKSIRSGLSLRIFDILGSGGFLLTNYQAELTDWFTIGSDLETYASADELYDKCSYYLSHDDERRRIAANGYAKAEQYHSYDIRIMQMFETALSD